jgi:hypothetical protein
VIAALFVAERGCYFGLPDVDPWPESRDARLYPGPHPVVAHPPCARWGKMAESAFGKKTGRLGDDGGCFASALASVRRYGGVLEHPAGTRAWQAHGLLAPRVGCGWEPSGDMQGWVTQVEQGWFGHRTRKSTWLYAVVGAVPLPLLPSGPSCPDGYEAGAKRAEAFTKLGARARALQRRCRFVIFC